MVPGNSSDKVSGLKLRNVDEISTLLVKNAFVAHLGLKKSTVGNVLFQRLFTGEFKTVALPLCLFKYLNTDINLLMKKHIYTQVYITSPFRNHPCVNAALIVKKRRWEGRETGLWVYSKYLESFTASQASSIIKQKRNGSQQQTPLCFSLLVFCLSFTPCHTHTHTPPSPSAPKIGTDL